MTVKNTRRDPSPGPADSGVSREDPSVSDAGVTLRDPLSVTQAAPTIQAAHPTSTRGQNMLPPGALDRSDTPTKDTTPPAGPGREGVPADLPPIRLPSLFKPAHFAKASQSRGARPRALKVIDAHLEAIESAGDPSEGFQQLQALQEALTDFVLRYGSKNTERLKVAKALKRWVDGAVTLRSPHFKGPSSEPPSGA